MAKVTIKSQLWRATYDNQRLEDLSSEVIDGRVTIDAARDVTWTMDLTLTRDGWRSLRAYQDWLAPVMTVTYPDGTRRHGQLGLYLVLDAEERHDEYVTTYQVEARDPLWLLAHQGYGNRLVTSNDPTKAKPTLIINPDDDRIKIVKAILDSAVLTEGSDGRQRYTIAGQGGNFKKRREWPRNTPLLTICNEILGSAGYYPLWTTRTGRFTSAPRGGRDASDQTSADIQYLRNRYPVRLYSANVPESVRMASGDSPLTARFGVLGGLDGEVVGTVEKLSGTTDIDNEFVIVVDAPDQVIRKASLASNPDNPRGRLAAEGRRKRKLRYVNGLDDDATAARVARALADEMSAQNRQIRMTVLPDPQADFIRETVALAIWSANGEQVAAGQYLVNTVDYGFTPDDGLMTLDLGRIDDLSGILEV